MSDKFSVEAGRTAESVAMRTIGRYRVEDVLGRGAFASVYLGHDDELEVAVAIKLLADNWAADPEVSERFLAEARLLRRIADPRVVRVYDVGTAAADHGTPQPYFVMDHVAGGTLADRIGSAAPEEVLHLCAEGARAVQVLHDWGIIHRDIKPGNLLVDDSRQKRRVVVSDLGTAKAMADATGITMTMGTPAYMAPEQVFSESGFDHRADVYALGVMTYVMLTGDPPYPIRSVADLVSGAELPPPPRIAGSLARGDTGSRGLRARGVAGSWGREVTEPWTRGSRDRGRMGSRGGGGAGRGATEYRAHGSRDRGAAESRTYGSG